ncbi:flavodoxin [Flavobacteriales bacterium]|nr:flavodoxin [Flavobacteriales bacterium]MDB2653195.1 flavodoxin [Flavobacteriales bacterium]MDG1396459.1 flavodoxin [Flavobacteriales bacterium]
MEKIGLFYGSDTGNTETIALKIRDKISKENVFVVDMYDASVEEFAKYDKIILGLSTWHDGQLQSDWDTFFEEFKEVDFTGKTVAIFGLGDQYVYCDYFIDGVGIIGEVVLNNGGEIVGKWSTEGYEHTESKAETEEGLFLGLALDEDNQFDQTDDRVDAWVAQIKKEFPL